MTEKRYMCSDLFRMRGTGGWTGWANLEEIWGSGAVLDSETPIAVGQKLLLRKKPGKLWAAVTDCSEYEFGYRVELKFLFDYVWTPKVFEPDHLLDPTQIAQREPR